MIKQNIMQIKMALELEFNNEETQNLVYRTIIQEAEEKINDRVQVTTTKKEKSLIIDFIARDTVSARAAANSYLKWINLSMELINEVKR